MAQLERTYIIPLRKEWLKSPRYKRSKKAITALRQFLEKHMKSEDVRILKELNEEVWKHGIKNPPGKIKVTTIKDKDGVVYAQLFGHKIDVKEEKKEKKEKKETKETKEKKETKKTETKKEVKTETKPVVKTEVKEEKPVEKKEEPKTEVKKEEPKVEEKETKTETKPEKKEVKTETPKPEVKKAEPKVEN